MEGVGNIVKISILLMIGKCRGVVAAIRIRIRIPEGVMARILASTETKKDKDRNRDKDKKQLTNKVKSIITNNTTLRLATKINTPIVIQGIPQNK